MPKLTPEEKSAELTKIMGVTVGANGVVKSDDDDSDDEGFSAQNRKPIQKSYTGEDDDDEDDLDDAPAAAAKGGSKNEDADDMPVWAQVLTQKNRELEEKYNSSQSEIHQLRNYQKPVEQPVTQKPAEPEESYWVNSDHLKEMESKYESKFQQLEQVSQRQERGSFDNVLSSLTKDRPDFFEVLPKKIVEQIWDTYKQDPHKYGGYGRNWQAEFDAIYKQFAYDRREKELKEEKAKNDELAKKRDERKAQQKTDLGKVSKGGAPVQEPKLTRDKGVRDYKHPSVRNRALSIFKGE